MALNSVLFHLFAILAFSFTGNEKGCAVIFQGEIWATRTNNGVWSVKKRINSKTLRRLKRAASALVRNSGMSIREAYERFGIIDGKWVVSQPIDFTEPRFTLPPIEPDWHNLILNVCPFTGYTSNCISLDAANHELDYSYSPYLWSVSNNLGKSILGPYMIIGGPNFTLYFPTTSNLKIFIALHSDGYFTSFKNKDMNALVISAVALNLSRFANTLISVRPVEYKGTKDLHNVTTCELTFSPSTVHAVAVYEAALQIYSTFVEMGLSCAWNWDE